MARSIIDTGAELRASSAAAAVASGSTTPVPVPPDGRLMVERQKALGLRS